VLKVLSSCSRPDVFSAPRSAAQADR
jgi:hypothetical protein